MKNTANKSSRFRRTKQNRLLHVANCAICSKRKPRFIKNQVASGLFIVQISDPNSTR